MTTNFRWALIGPGWIAAKFVEALSAPGCGQLQGVLASSNEKGQAFLSEQGIPGARVYSDINALLADEKVDAVYISTPHNSHHYFAAECLRRGLPVLCEKPLTVNLFESRQLVDIARQNSVFLMEAMWSKLLPVWQRAKQIIDEGELGQIDFLSANMGYKFEYSPTARLFNPALAGGILMDMGVYTVALANWLLAQSPEQINASAEMAGSGVDQKTQVRLRYKNGITTQFLHTAQTIPDNCFWIVGTRGKLCINSMFWQAERLQVELNDEWRVETHPLECNGFEYQLREVIQCLENGLVESPRVSHAATLGTMQVLDQIREQIGLRFEGHDYAHAYA
ncbi:MAG: Gfo/Idh/MocA family oxidoreductase [Pseudomonadota bacterium]